MEIVNKKILLVEDDPNFGSILKDYLVMNDFEVVLAKNGMEGFEKFKKEDFDVCILDVMMPYKDGFTLAREIREKNEQVLRYCAWHAVGVRILLTHPTIRKGCQRSIACQISRS